MTSGIDAATFALLHHKRIDLRTRVVIASYPAMPKNGFAVGVWIAGFDNIQGKCRVRAAQILDPSENVGAHRLMAEVDSFMVQ